MPHPPPFLPPQSCQLGKVGQRTWMWTDNVMIVVRGRMKLVLNEAQQAVEQLWHAIITCSHKTLLQHVSYIYSESGTVSGSLQHVSYIYSESGTVSGPQDWLSQRDTTRLSQSPSMVKQFSDLNLNYDINNS